jgi:hypothetical protein
VKKTEILLHFKHHSGVLTIRSDIGGKILGREIEVAIGHFGPFYPQVAQLLSISNWLIYARQTKADMAEENDDPIPNSRAMRRALAQITPGNSDPQTQSPLLTVLPSEIRNSIFEYAVCQTINCSRPVSNTSHTHRPGHEYDAHIDTALLRTCRLIYYETRTLPLRSATHHLYEEPSESFNPLDWDHYLFHLSSQSGQTLHHLHVTKWSSPFTYVTLDYKLR